MLLNQPFDWSMPACSRKTKKSKILSTQTQDCCKVRAPGHFERAADDCDLRPKGSFWSLDFKMQDVGAWALHRPEPSKFLGS